MKICSSWPQRVKSFEVGLVLGTSSIVAGSFANIGIFLTEGSGFGLVGFADDTFVGNCFIFAAIVI